MNYYNSELSDDARDRLGIIFFNRATIENTKVNLDNIAANARDGSVAVVQDKGTWMDGVLFDRISNDDNNPKDDMAVFDKAGRLIRYFQSSESNWAKGKVKAKVNEVLAPGYVNPCGPLPEDESSESSEDTEPPTVPPTPAPTPMPTPSPISEEEDDDTGCKWKEFAKLKGTKQQGKGKKQKDACDCHDSCLAGNYKGFLFKAKKNPKKPGLCVCFEKVKRVQKGKGKAIAGKIE